jgi:hypothetical protein
MVGMLVAAVLAIVSPVIALLAVPLFIYAIVMGIVLLVWYCTEGHQVPNRYGPPPVALHAGHGYGYGQPAPYARTAAPPYGAPAAPHLRAYPAAPGQQLPYPAGPAPDAPGSGGLPSWGTQPQAQPAQPQPQPPQQPAAQQPPVRQDPPLDPPPWEPPAGPAEPPASPPPFR